MADFAKLAADYNAATDRQAEISDELKAAGKVVADAEIAMFEAMVEAELPSLTADGHTFEIDLSTKYSCLADRRDALYEVLKPYGREGIFKTTFSVHAGTLQATMREWETQGGIPADVVALLTVFDKPVLKVKAAKKK